MRDPVLENHPLKKGALKKDWKGKTIPIILHGDGVNTKTGIPLWFGAGHPYLIKKVGIQSHQLLASFPKSCSTTSTFPSLGMAAMELHSPCKRDSPQRRPFWEAFEKRYHGRAGRAGFALSRDRAAIWSIGDNVFFSNTLLLPHWASHFPCWNCDGQNFAESAGGKHVREIRMDKQKFDLVTHAEALKKAHETHAKALKKAEDDKAKPLKSF